MPDENDPQFSGEAQTIADRQRGPILATLGALIVPGAASLLRHRVLSAILLLLGFVAPAAVIVVVIVRRDDLASLALDTTILRTVQAGAFLFVITRVIAVGEVIFAKREGQSPRAVGVVAVLGIIALVVPVLWSVSRVQNLNNVIAKVFVSSGDNAPLANNVTDGSNVIGDSGNPDQPDEKVSLGFETILLLGGDEGPDRGGLRTDTMILLIIHRDSGRAAMISVPRNLMKIKFPPGSVMAQEFTKGFSDITNAIYPYVHNHPEVAVAYKRGDLQPEVLALASGLSYTMNIRIDDYVLVNMQGFIEIIDALGGVTINIEKKLTMPGNVPGGKHSYPSTIGPGEVKLDGTLALGYARSRKTDSDYQRMDRQRGVLTALASQVSGTELLLKFPKLAGIMQKFLRTSLTPKEFAELIHGVKNEGQIKESVGLVPPLVIPSEPDYEKISLLIDGIQTALSNNVDFPDP